MEAVSSTEFGKGAAGVGRFFQTPAWRILIWWCVLLAVVTVPCMLIFTAYDHEKGVSIFSDATCGRVLYAQRAIFWSADLLVVIYVAFAPHRWWLRCLAGVALIASVYLLWLVEDSLVVSTYLSWEVGWPRVSSSVRWLAYQALPLIPLRLAFGPIQRADAPARPRALRDLFGLTTAIAVLIVVAQQDPALETPRFLESLLKQSLLAAGLVLAVLGSGYLAPALGVAALYAYSVQPTPDWHFPLPGYAATIGVPFLMLRFAGYRLRRRSSPAESSIAWSQAAPSAG